MLPRLTLPPPHRLSGHSRPQPRSLPSSTALTNSRKPTKDGRCERDTTDVEAFSPFRVMPKSSASFDVDVREETDSGPPRAKRPKKSPTASLVPPIVQTFDAKPLKSFSLYLPSHLPASIVEDSSAFTDYALSTAATYLGLWWFDHNMDSVDIRVPQEYSTRLQSTKFLEKFLGVAFNKSQLSTVKSIKELYLPQVSITKTCTSFVDTFQKLSQIPFSIRTVFLPVSFSEDISTAGCLNLTKVSKAATNLHSVKEITLVSGNAMLPQFLDALREKISTPTVEFSLSSDETGSSGPEYIAELEKSTPMGELISPHSLVDSLNTNTVGEGDKSSSHRASKTRSDSGKARSYYSPQKGSLKQTFTTDCSYAEEAQISPDNTFVSKVWDLERLHSNGIDGSGTTIAVLDSGINYMSPAFKNKVLTIRNFVPNAIDDIDCAIDSDGHGSLCAGIAACSSFYCPINNKDPRSPCLKIPPGVAPGAKLVICKVVSTTTGDVDNTAFLEALKWLKEVHTSGDTHIDVVSISLASSYFSHERAVVIGELVDCGVIVVCCASNVGRMKMQPISFPARLGHVLCVGAHDDNGKPTSFSPVGRELDFLAPGDDIWGPGPGTKGPFAMDCGSGTSCSTPAIAGLICLVLHDIRRRCTEDHEIDTTIAGKPISDYVQNVWVMRELLKEMSSSPGHHSEEIGYGTLNPYRLLDSNTEEIVRIVNGIIEDED